MHVRAFSAAEPVHGTAMRRLHTCLQRGTVHRDDHSGLKARQQASPERGSGLACAPMHRALKARHMHLTSQLPTGPVLDRFRCACPCSPCQAKGYIMDRGAAHGAGPFLAALLPAAPELLLRAIFAAPPGW